MREKRSNFESEILGMPPIKMVLVEGQINQNDRTPYEMGKYRKVGNEYNKEDVILRLIDYLISKP